MPRKKKIKVVPQEGMDIEVPVEVVKTKKNEVETLIEEFKTRNGITYRLFLKGTTYTVRNGLGQLIAQGMKLGEGERMMQNLHRFD